MTLADMKDGEVCSILNVLSKKDLKRRLFDLGFFPGMQVECVIRSPFESPILFKVNGALIALRAIDAKEIEVIHEK